MYAHIRGKLIRLEPSFAIVEAGQIGYKIAIPFSATGSLIEGDEVFLHTSFVVRESFQGLYGFLLSEERDLFETLIEVSGIGPKTAISLIGHLTLEGLHEAVIAEDTSSLSKVPGIGKKTAERLLVELKNKLNLIDPPSKSLRPKNQSIQDAVKALVRLGYNPSAAHKAIKKAVPDGEEPQDAGLLITAALKHI